MNIVTRQVQYAKLVMLIRQRHLIEIVTAHVPRVFSSQLITILSIM